MSYVGYLNGHEYQAAMTQDPDIVKLLSRGVEPVDRDFVERRPGLWVRQVRLDELDGLYDVTLRCEYKGHPFIVTADLGDELGVQYIGGDIRVAEALGLSIDEPLVATGSFARNQVENLREVRRQVWPRDGDV
jgi:hypothetical protein